LKQMCQKIQKLMNPNRVEEEEGVNDARVHLKGQQSDGIFDGRMHSNEYYPHGQMSLDAEEHIQQVLHIGLTSFMALPSFAYREPPDGSKPTTAEGGTGCKNNQVSQVEGCSSSPSAPRDYLCLQPCSPLLFTRTILNPDGGGGGHSGVDPEIQRQSASELFNYQSIGGQINEANNGSHGVSGHDVVVSGVVDPEGMSNIAEEQCS